MKRISTVDLLEPGQVLGADVCGVDGACMAFAGSVLDAEAIARLRTAGLSTVMLELNDAAVRELAAAQPSVDDPETLFSLNDLNHPLIQKLVEVAREQRA